MRKIPLSKVFINEEVQGALLRAAESGWYILAKECELFENELATHTGTCASQLFHLLWSVR